jgi:hypothetical protein
MTTQTFDPPPSAQRTSGGGEPGGVGSRAGMSAGDYIVKTAVFSRYMSTKQELSTKEDDLKPAVLSDMSRITFG